MKNAGQDSPHPSFSYIGVSPEEQSVMLGKMGLKSKRDLFKDIPENLLFAQGINIPGPYSEAELSRLFDKISKENAGEDFLSFLGGGLRQIYIPAFLEELMRRGEIYTAYTSYQPEVAQGILQLIFEYESQLAELTGMDVINASMYDWASALGELARMMIRIKRNKKAIIVLEPLSPRRKEVLATYTSNSNIEVISVPSDGGLNVEAAIKCLQEDFNLEKKIRKIAGIYFEVPTYHGVLPERVKELVTAAHDCDVLVGVGVDLVSLGIIEPPGEYGADFIIGEGQILGNAISSGGPLLGILGSKYDRKWIQNFPGRLVGITTDLRDKDPAYCITLSTREQHIRRGRATSNICTNQTLMAINSSIYLAGLGPNGITELAQGLMDRAYYLARKLNEISNVQAPLYEPIFADFVIEIEGITHEELERRCFKMKIIPGTKINGSGCRRLIAVSDTHLKEDLDKFVQAIREVCL